MPYFTDQPGSELFHSTSRYAYVLALRDACTLQGMHMTISDVFTNCMLPVFDLFNTGVCTLLFAGMPMCGHSCTKAWGRCFQNLSCASLVLSLPSQCSNVVAWSGERDLPACCSDCRDTLDMISKLPNALELECCNCSGDLSCEMLQMKLAAACPSRTNCQRVHVHSPTI